MPVWEHFQYNRLDQLRNVTVQRENCSNLQISSKNKLVRHDRVEKDACKCDKCEHPHLKTL